MLRLVKAAPAANLTESVAACESSQISGGVHSGGGAERGDEGSDSRRRGILSELTLRYRSHLVGVAYRFSLNQAEAEDVVHAVLVRMVLREDRIARIEERGEVATSRTGRLMKPLARMDNAPGFLVDSVLNECRSRWRLEQRRHEALARMPEVPETTSADEEPPEDDGGESERLYQAVRQLKPLWRRIFRMRMLKMPFKEIGARLGLTVPSVTLHWFRARRELKRILDVGPPQGQGARGVP